MADWCRGGQYTNKERENKISSNNQTKPFEEKFHQTIKPNPCKNKISSNDQTKSCGDKRSSHNQTKCEDKISPNNKTKSMWEQNIITQSNQSFTM